MSTWTKRVLGFLIVIAGITAQAASAQVRVTPRAPFPSVDTKSPSDAALQKYIGSLRFEDNPGAGDRQALLIGSYPGSAQIGPLATIQPEVGNYLLTKEQLEQGRILARIINESTEKYPKLGLLPRSITYWWVQGDYQRRRGRSVFIATDSTGRILGRFPGVLEFDEHPQYKYQQASARFWWVDRDEQAWSPCTNGCCRGYTGSQ